MFAYRGVAYDTGTNFATGQGELSRTVWNTELMESEIDLVTEMNCNSVTVYGTDLDRLRATAAAAVSRGLHVWFQPRLVDHSQAEILEHLAEGARIAESLRAEGGHVDLIIGDVHTVFTPGIVTGEIYHERMANVFAGAEHFLLTPTAVVDVAASAPVLNDFLAQAVAVARENFSGAVTYSAAPFEEVDWSPFDFVALSYHFLPVYHSQADHVALLDRYRGWDKPIVISEFGGATYHEAEEKAFFFWDIVDRSDEVPTVVEGYDRDEDAQVAYHRKMFDLFAEAGVEGVAVSELVHPTHPYSDDPRFDLDIASMALLKTVRDDFSDPDSTYRLEPKKSFHAIASYYGREAVRKAS